MTVEEYKIGEMHNYYSSNNFLPTYASFKSIEQLHNYELSRHALFNKLKIPKRVFKDAKLIELGPDSGENALVYAKLGSKIHLIEPNLNAIKVLRENFIQFNCLNSITAISHKSLEEFDCNERFDFLSAEGFIYTLQQNFWIKKCAALLKEDALMLMTYMEANGSTYEILLKVLYQYGCEIFANDSMIVAEKLFRQKWDSIPHTRSFHSWYMDCIKNPFVRSKFFYKADELLMACKRQGLYLYSSLPVYEDNLHIAWHKVQEDKAINSSRIEKYIKRSILSYFFGETCFYAKTSDNTLITISTIIAEVVHLLDSQIDGIDREKLLKLIKSLNYLDSLLNKNQFICESHGSIKEKLLMLRQILELVQMDKREEFIHFCQHDERFIKTWGLPVHVVVFKKTNKNEDDDR